MSGIEGMRRPDPSNLHPNDDPSRASEAKRPEVAPWNVDYDKIPSGILEYDRALFDRPPVAFVPVAAPAPRTSGSAAADAAWNAVRNAPFPALAPSATPSCAPHVATPRNAGSFADRGVPLASAIARRHGVTIPSWIRIEVDATIREAASFAEYRLGTDASGPTHMMPWSELAPDGFVVVRVHPSVLKSDEKIVGVIQHEVWELSQLRARVEARQMLPAETIRDLINPLRASNLHGQAWDIADLRVLIMRENDPAKKAALVERLTRLAERYAKENLR